MREASVPARVPPRAAPGFSSHLAGLATAIGSLPHTDPGAALKLVLAHLPELPAWPQLPRRSTLESMYAQFSQGLPGVVVTDRIYVERARDLSGPLERLYQDYLEDRLDGYAIGRDYAAGLHLFLEAGVGEPRGVKGQTTGPVSLGLALADEEGRPIIYDDVLSDALARFLRLKAAWQERELGQLGLTTIIFLDEPYLASLGSAFVSVTRERALRLLEETLGGISCLKGIHCCGNTDWSLPLTSSADILSLDAYDYAETLALYPEEVQAFLGRGGALAWGIVPTQEAVLARETPSSLRDRLIDALDMLSAKGIAPQVLVERCLITPACGLGSLSLEAAERALELAAGVSRLFRKKYKLE